jgi:predicted amino acid racemase
LLTDGLGFADQSSDHTVFLADRDINFEVGDIISFQPDYFGLLSCMTSPFVKKLYLE